MGDERTPFGVEQVELSYSAALDPPAFDLGKDWPEFQSALYAQLRSLGLRLSDIKVESSTPNPSDTCVAAWMFSHGAVARYRLDRVEVWSNSQRVGEDTELASEIVVRTMAVLHDLSPSAVVKVHSISTGIHGTLSSGGPGLARIASFVQRTPRGPLPLTPSGVSFLCDISASRGQGSVILERSMTLVDGAYLRVMSDHPGSVSERDALTHAVTFFQEVTSQLGFDVNWRV